jgi:hypothetical protein
MITASFKITHEQMGALRGYAHKRHMTISDYLRAIVFPKSECPPKRIFRKNPISGVLVDATPVPTITPEMVKQALADYP